MEAMMIASSRESLEQGDPLGLPWDIGEWVDKARLITWIDAELEGIDWQNPTIVAFEQKHPQFRPKMFLRLLTYAYATGIYASEDIGEACYRDEMFRQICEGDP